MAIVPKKIMTVLDLLYPVRDKYPQDQRLCFDPSLNSLIASNGNLSLTFNFTNVGINFMADLGIIKLTYIPRMAVVGLLQIKKISFIDDLCRIYQDFETKRHNSPLTDGTDIFVETTQYFIGEHPPRRNLEEVASKYSIKSLFDENELEAPKRFWVTKSKKKFDRIIEALNKELPYVVSDELTYARGECETDGFHFELAVVTPKAS